MTADITYRALAKFWAAVAILAAGGGITLQLLGPVPATRAVSAAAPVAPRPMSTLPLPAPAKPASVIPPPSDDLLAGPNPPIPTMPNIRLPKVADDKHTWPALYYAAPFDAADKNPRIALVLSGAGLDENLTLQLLRDLPGAVDVAFSAYMPPERSDTLAQAARDTGHECLQSIPMEPSNAPMADEGPRQLVSGMSSDQYTADLFWSLSRLGGCVGATGAADNGMRGDRFVTDPNFTAMLAEITSRGLLYLDPLTRTPVLYPAGLDAPSLPDPGRVDFLRKTDIVIDQSVNDEPQTADDIRQNLAQLEKRASLDRPAIGLAINLNPRLVGILHDWANGLPARGVTLVPLSATPKIPPPPPPVVLNQDPNQAK